MVRAKELQTAGVKKPARGGLYVVGGWLEAVLDAGLAHDAVGGVPGIAVSGYGLVSDAVGPCLVRSGLAQKCVSVRLQLLDDQIVKTLHAGTAVCQMKSVCAWGFE